ncbi:RHS repeat-associated core domain-containing protein [Pseudomonas putida]|uniref:RHS repeat-associated core domain-containing protein n=1 Tax=Pseudomonas putida TaxID=303 RepID=UPI001F529977|nr:RHS repeat-associated core domain-containing protein [Pseudomonas putida]MCI1020758.1 RHS repeat-associated core domain-containing protein [Pseudomonas putida]
MAKLSNTNRNHTFTPYGHSKTPCNPTNSLQFHGELLHSTVGLYFLGLGARTYNPRIFRFHSSDSLSPFSLGGINSYTYCFNDPINLSDPTGRSPLLPRSKTITIDTNWTFKSRPDYVQKQFRWGNSSAKIFNSDESPATLSATPASKQQLHESSDSIPPSRRAPEFINVAPQAIARLPDSTRIYLKSYIRTANQHNDFKAQNVRHLPPDSPIVKDFIQNFGEARRLRTALKEIVHSTLDEFEHELLSAVLRVRL